MLFPSSTKDIFALRAIKDTQEMTKSQLPSKVLTLQPRLAINDSPTTFEPFNDLPTEIQIYIIRYAWNNIIQSTRRCLFVTSTFSNTAGATAPPVHSQHYRSIRIDSDPPTLNLVSKLFRNECRFRAKPHMLQIPISNQNRCIFFMPDADLLTIHIKGTGICAQTILTSFKALPTALRHIVRYVSIDYSTDVDMYLVLFQLGITGLADMLCEMDAPLLESVTISTNKNTQESWKRWRKGKISQHRDEVYFNRGVRMFAAD